MPTAFRQTPEVLARIGSHAARARTRLHGLDQLVGGIQHCEGAALFVRDEDQAGVLGPGWSCRKSQQGGKHHCEPKRPPSDHVSRTLQELIAMTATDTSKL